MEDLKAQLLAFGEQGLRIGHAIDRADEFVMGPLGVAELPALWRDGPGYGEEVQLVAAVAFRDLVLPGDPISRGFRGLATSGGAEQPLQRLQSELLSKC